MFQKLSNRLLKSCSSQSLETPFSLLFNFNLATEFPSLVENCLNFTSSQETIL